MQIRLKTGVQLALLGWALLGMGQAHAQLTPTPIAGPGGQAQGLAAVGLEDPVNGFPRYFTDKNGLSLEQCLTPVNVAIGAANPGGDMCGLTTLLGTDPVTGLSNDGKTPVFPTMFPPELFYNRAVAVMKNLLPGGNTATLVIQVEGAFLPAAPAAGNQTAFARIRYNVTGGLTPGGTYTITHPFGINTFVADASGALPRNQGVIDQGCLSPSCAGLFDQVLPTTNAGPFLVWDNALPAPPTGYMGDPNVLHTIKGSPFGTNFFKMEGPGLPVGGITISQWGIWGKIYVPGAQPPAVVLSRTTYTRTITGTNLVNIFAQAESGSTLTASVGGTSLGSLQEDPANKGTFFGRLPAAGALVPGTPITVTATNAVGSSVVGGKLVDDVIIDSAAYDYTGILTVKAHSTDEVSVPTLSASGNPGGGLLGDVLPAVGLVRTTVAPPANVKVTSTNGGSAISKVDPNPVTVNRATTTIALTPATATVQLGSSVTLTATVTPGAAGTPTGQVSFKVGANTIGTALLDATGSATLTIAPTPVGSYSITASYAGDATFGPSTSPASTIAVSKANSTTTVTASAATVNAGSPLTFTATVAKVGATTLVPGGTVQFLDGTTVMGTGTLANGVATLTTSAFAGSGARSITAQYLGDANFVTSTSAATTVTIASATSTTTLAGGTNLTSNRTTILGVVLHAAVSLDSTVAATPAQPSITGTLSYVVVSATGTGLPWSVGSTVASTTTIGNGTTNRVSWTPQTGNYAGTITLRAVYSGSATIAGSNSGANLITVTIR